MSGMLLVVVPPWDIDVAGRAGLRTALIDRADSPYPAHFAAPDMTASGSTDLAVRLAGAADP